MLEQNYIKRQAKEHDGFRRFAIKQAQRVHQIDMRMRLGILHDPEAQQRMHEREHRAAEERKRKQELSTVRTEAEQKKFEEEQARGEKDGPERKEKPVKVKIRPLSEGKAIELGANFFSEAFIFAVAAGLIIWDTWRSRKKESARRDDIAERLGDLEAEVERLRSKYEPHLEPLDVKPKITTYAWYNPSGWFTRSEPVKAEGEEGASSIAGNVPIANPEKSIQPTPVSALAQETDQEFPTKDRKASEQTSAKSLKAEANSTPQSAHERTSQAQPGIEKGR